MEAAVYLIFAGSMVANVRDRGLPCGLVKKTKILHVMETYFSAILLLCELSLHGIGEDLSLYSLCLQGKTTPQISTKPQMGGAMPDPVLNPPKPMLIWKA